MKAIKVTTVITSVSARANNSAGLRLSTPALTPEELTAIFHLKDQDCETLLVPIAKHDEEVMQISSDLQSKTPSQRLRACLYILWDQEAKEEKWPVFYEAKMESMIEFIKNKLD